MKATNPTPRASTHGLALTTATAHARQLVSRPHTGRPPGPTCLARASVADKSINVISGRTLCYHWIHAVLDGLYLTGGESPTCTPVYCHNTNGYTGGPSPPHLPPRSLRCACTSLFPETPVTSESCSNLAESANQADSEILQKFQANRASPPLASTGTAIGVIPTHDCAFPERARPLVTAGPGVSPFATTQLATDMSPAAQQGSTEALSNFERDPCVTVPLSTCTAPRKIPTPEICDFSKSALTGASRHRQRSGVLLRSLGTTQGSRPGCLGRPRAGSASAANHKLATTPHRAVSPPLPAPLRAIPTTKYRSCDLGCGGGGTSLGLQLAGVEVGMGVDLNGMSLKAFERNFPGALAHPGDLHRVASVIAAIKACGGINVIAASSPCQPHSPSTPKSSLIHDDPRAQLTLRIAEIVVGVMPSVFILENVAGLLKSRYGYWDKAKALLRQHGYHVSWSVVDAAKVGVPQHRRRLLVVATLHNPVDVPAAAKLLHDLPDTTVRNKLPELGDVYYHYSRDNRSSCVRSADTACPTLRTNCHHFPSAYVPRRSDCGRSFTACRRYTVRELGTLSGWPPDAWLPSRLKDAMFILGNCVPPPMMHWLFDLVTAADASAHSTEMERLHANVQRYCAVALPNADLTTFDCAAAIDPNGMAVQAIIDEYDFNRPGAYTSPLAGTTDPWIIAHDRAVPDPDCNVTGVHRAQLQRRERLRTSVLLQTKTRSDGSTRDLREPIWNAPPRAIPPCSNNPTGMFGARPYVRVPDSPSVLHSSSRVSAQYKHWASAHVTHCMRCIEHSTAVVGKPPPIAQIQSAHRTGYTPERGAVVLCPDCYQVGMLADIKEGFDPHISPAPVPVRVANGGSCFDEWEQTLKYMAKLDKLGCMADGVWEKPEDAVISALHVVTRPSDMRRFKRDGTPYAVRTVTDLTKSKVNDAQDRWRFRLEGADGAVRLIGQTGHKFLGACDISKYFPSIGLHPRAQRYCWIFDPRCATKWGGKGKPSAAWLKYRAERVASGIRTPPYRRCTGMPLGLALAPAFACSLSAEIVQILAAMGIKAVQYVDDALVSGSTIIECQCNMDTAMSVLRWLGFTCNQDKTTGPSTCLKFIGYEFDTVAGTIAIGDDRKAELISLLSAATAAKRIDTRDLETLIGKLVYTASVMRGGNAFIYRMRVAHRAAATAKLKHTSLGHEPLADMTWWLRQLRGPWAGSRMFIKDQHLPILKMKSDASGGTGPDAATLGWGYQLGRAIHWQRWDPATAVVTEQHIQWKELLAISHVCTEYGHLFANSILRCSVDNSGVQYIVNKLSSSCPTLMHLLRIIADAQCRHNFDIVASHVSREFNELTDCLSRWQVPADMIPFLPPGVTLPPWLQSLEPKDARHHCQTRSQASSGHVFRALLQLQSSSASVQAPPLATTSSASSSTSSAASCASPPTSNSTRCPTSSSGTSLASTRRSTTPTRHARSSSPRGATTATTTASSFPARALPLSAASLSSSRRSECSSRTRRAKTSRSLSASSPAWLPITASTALTASGPSTRSCSVGGRAASMLTLSASAVSSTGTVPGAPTSNPRSATTPAPSACATASPSTRAAHASFRSASVSAPSSTSARSSASSSGASTAPPSHQLRCSPRLPGDSPAPKVSRASHSTRGLLSRSPPPKFQAASASPVSVQAAPRTCSPRARQTATCKSAGAGGATPTSATTAPPSTCKSASSKHCSRRAARGTPRRSAPTARTVTHPGGESDDCLPRVSSSRYVQGGETVRLSRPKAPFCQPSVLCGWGGEWRTRHSIKRGGSQGPPTLTTNNTNTNTNTSC